VGDDEWGRQRPEKGGERNGEREEVQAGRRRGKRRRGESMTEGMHVGTWASGMGRRVCSVFRALLVRCGAMGETSTWTVAGSCVWVARAGGCVSVRVCWWDGGKEGRRMGGWRGISPRRASRWQISLPLSLATATTTTGVTASWSLSSSPSSCCGCGWVCRVWCEAQSNEGV